MNHLKRWIRKQLLAILRDDLEDCRREFGALSFRVQVCEADLQDLKIPRESTTYSLASAAHIAAQKLDARVAELENVDKRFPLLACQPSASDWCDTRPQTHGRSK